MLDTIRFRKMLNLIFILGCIVLLSAAAPNYEDNKKELGGLIAGIFSTTEPSSPPSTPNRFDDTGANTNDHVYNPRNDPKLTQTIHEIFQMDLPNKSEPKAVDVPLQSDFDDTSCECVSYFQCKNGTIIDNGINLIDIRIQGSCDSYLNTCCYPPDLKHDTEITKPKSIQTCGIRNVGGVGFRITGDKDNEAQFGEFPWMAAVLKEERHPDLVNVYVCGGAIIHPQVVLTAAHCVNGKEPNLLKIRAGEWDTQTKNEIFPHQDRQVESVVIHERFHSGALLNDFALLFLNEPLDLLENVATICLPEATDNFDGAECYASGWGKDTFGKQGHYQVILKRVNVPMVPHNICLNALRETRLGYHFKLDPSFVCAGGEGKDTCQGDGGSPLVCPLLNKPGRYAQVGIVAWGIGCGGASPGVYANVAGARQWIDKQMSFHNFDSKYYSYYID